ncbi:DEAD/DEAH box helicase family protein [Methanosphaera sp. Vir-13MRS]|uniref:DEAD/DEAH box helicase family protein n=1 Tax=Candidatus Methanosphaera massiliense TaxID=3017187 RepID=UPI0023803B4F|nr:DEAD/DEAH box helicase family protein [Candidatus Methanosphaera massiliense]MDE4078684.1 DEAD/DEAH box helicase family protein [Candidatus Methanosphaera massiliense]
MNFNELLDKGEKRALLVSATGTGKTYASAFAVKAAHPRKFLFVVYREQKAKQAIESYKHVFKGEDDKFGLLTGNSHDYDKEYLFITVQTMNKDHIYTRYSGDEFDYIDIDEVHKAGADSYQKLFEYFTPKFYLGMSASPDRTDDFNIYELFDYNVPLDIRLEDTLKEDLLCPFQYFGISDLEINGKVLTDESEFRYLTSDARVDYILEKSDFYGYSGSR